MSQCDIILGLLKQGLTVTKGMAEEYADCARLAARIGDLKELGHDIEMIPYTYENYKGVAKTVGTYRLKIEHKEVQGVML